MPCHVVGIAPFPPTWTGELGFKRQLEDLDILNCHALRYWLEYIR